MTISTIHASKKTYLKHQNPTSKLYTKNVKKNKIIAHEFTFDELRGKIGTFIIEFQGNGKLASSLGRPTEARREQRAKAMVGRILRAGV